jgi:hypothetical protein
VAEAAGIAIPQLAEASGLTSSRIHQGLAELAADALWLGIAIWLLVEGVVEHNSSELAAATFMFWIAGLLGLLTFVFHWEHLWVKPVTDFCDCF